ncbi:DMT family transporter [Alteromonadaceae bacterium BrNp21-10]|nr:DMT family transporter [Alteromonadaceae bacterium BrNp21-10]
MNSPQTNMQPMVISGLLLALAGTFMFSVKPILIKQAYLLDLTSVQVMTLRMLFSLPFYLLVAGFSWYKYQDKRPAYRSNLLLVAVLGILGYYVASFLDLLGLQYISAQLERVVLFCFPTIVVVMSRVFFKTPISKRIWPLLGLSYGGILLIFGHDMMTLGGQVAVGTALVFGSAISFAIYVLWSKPLMSKIGSQMFTSIAMIAASIAIFSHFAVTQPLVVLNVPLTALILTAAIALFCTVIPSFLVAEAINKIGPERTSIVGTCGPVITSFIAVIWLGEAFTWFHFGGLTMVILAVALMVNK